MNGFLKKNKTARTDIAQGTVLNWMNALGYKYDRIMKDYFNDKHKDKTNVLCITTTSSSATLDTSDVAFGGSISRKRRQ